MHLGDYRLGEHQLTASTIATAWADGDSTRLHQVIVTTFSDQLPAHGEVLHNLA